MTVTGELGASGCGCDYPIALPMMVCPACEERLCPVELMSHESKWAYLGFLGEGNSYHLLCSCPCGAQWSFMVEGKWARAPRQWSFMVEGK